ncbi:MAG TPA: hypothetical protein VNX40_13670 [Mucilaginibacter sp.]|jgi:hypothetical protein|nr:hypothetical protein [Mucilaginibacter sp.]
MNLESYNYEIDETFQTYEFVSEGPNGKVTKVVAYTEFGTVNDEIAYNLGFGDIDEKTGRISDTVVTDNKDRPLVLATVAQTIVEFSSHFGKHWIRVRGSTPARTRLYQMGVSGIWDEIKDDFELYGLKDGKYIEFEKDVNYEAFLVRKK